MIPAAMARSRISPQDGTLVLSLGRCTQLSHLTCDGLHDISPCRITMSPRTSLQDCKRAPTL
jgi:hypothetical protein